jgi:ketosteroid isomerase-like protein
MVEQRSRPADVSHRFAEAINAGDLDGALECWSAAAVIAAADGSEVRGHTALAQRFRQLIAMGAHLQISVSNEICTELGATARTRMTMTLAGNDGPAVIEVSAVVAYVSAPTGLQILIDQLIPQVA